MRPYSTDLRERVAAAVDDGEGSLRDIAATFRVSLSFVSRSDPAGPAGLRCRPAAESFRALLTS